MTIDPERRMDETGGPAAATIEARSPPVCMIIAEDDEMVR